MPIEQQRNADIEWPDGRTPYSRRFQDRYFDSGDGLSESRQVFLAGNGLPERFGPGFHIAELGFGTGLNMLASLHAWRTHEIPGTLRFTSFEAFLLSEGEMRRALGRFPELAPLAEEFLAVWGCGRVSAALPQLDLEVVPGDARDTVPGWGGAADAWFLDGFAPARNPEIWDPALLASVARCTAPGGTFATYSAAGTVRRALADAGFLVERRPGFGRKRHMCAGRLGA